MVLERRHVHAPQNKKQAFRLQQALIMFDSSIVYINPSIHPQTTPNVPKLPNAVLALGRNHLVSCLEFGIQGVQFPVLSMELSILCFKSSILCFDDSKSKHKMLDLKHRMLNSMLRTGNWTPRIPNSKAQDKAFQKMIGRTLEHVVGGLAV